MHVAHYNNTRVYILKYIIHNNVIVKTIMIRLNVRSVGENSSQRRGSAFHEETTNGGRRARVMYPPGVNDAAQAHTRAQVCR